MRYIQSTIFVFILTVSNSYAGQSDAFNAVQRMFAGMAAYDYDAMHDSGTDDYQLLEHGEVWDMDDLVAVIKPLEGKLTRRNYFSIIKEVTSDDNVWISYWNRGDYVMTDGKSGSMTWLESAVIIKVDGTWKVQMLHSTRLGQEEKMPEDVVMEEYIP